MPQIPKFSGGSAKISESVGREQVSSTAGLVEQAYGQLAGQISSMAAGYYQKQYNQEARNQKTDALNKLDTESSGLIQELDEKYADSDHKGYAEEYNSRILDISKGIEEGMTNGDAKAGIVPLFSNKIVGNRLKLDHEEYQRSNRYYSANTQRQQKQSLTQISETGDFGHALSGYRQAVTDAEFYKQENNPEAAQLIEKQLGKWADAAVTGAITSGSLAKMKEAEMLLTSEDSDYSAMFGALTPGKKRSLLNSVRSQMNNMQTAEGKVIKMDVSATVNSLRAGIPQDTEALKSRIASSIPDPLERDMLMATVDEAVIVSDVQKQSAADPNFNVKSAINNAVDNYEKTSPIVAKGLRASLTIKSDKILRELDSQMRKDPTTFFYRNNPMVHTLADRAFNSPTDFNEYKSHMDELYEKWNVPAETRSYASPAMKEQGRDINDRIAKQDFLGASQAINQIDTTADLSSYNMLLEMGIKPSNAVLADTGRNLETAFNVSAAYPKLIEGTAKLDIQENKSLLREDPMYEAFLSSGDEADKVTAEAALDFTHKYYTKLVNDGLSEGDAKDRAWELYNDKFTSLDSARSKILFPRNKGYDPTKTSSYMNRYTRDFTAADVNALGIDVPSINTPEEYAEGIREDGFFILDRNDGKLKLYVKRNNINFAVKDSKGNTVSKSLEDITVEEQVQDAIGNKAVAQYQESFKTLPFAGKF